MNQLVPVHIEAHLPATRPERAAITRHTDGPSAGTSDARGGRRQGSHCKLHATSHQGKAIFVAMKKFFFLGACLVALASSPVKAQTIKPEVIVVQVYSTGIGTGHVAVTRGEDKTEDIEFKVTSAKQHTAAETYQRVFAQLVQEGYSLKSTIAPGEGGTVTLVFEKRQ
jgi:hypothetical protein